VTLNDPVHVEAAQALARRIARSGGSLDSRIDYAFRVCIARLPKPDERARVANLFTSARDSLARESASALKLATEPLGPAPKDLDITDLAAWTVVSNVLLNMDEMLMRR
jgi:hypothetical protein